MSKVLFEDKERQLTITQYDREDHVVVKFGGLEVSMNKSREFRDMAYLIRGGGCEGVSFDYDADPEDRKWQVNESVNMISLWYLHGAKRKLEALKEAYQILQEKD